MPEPTQFSFELSELAEVLLERQGIKEGRWMIAFQFDMIAGNIGLPGGAPRPSAMLSVARALLVKADPRLPQGSGIVVDAGSLAHKLPQANVAIATKAKTPVLVGAKKATAKAKRTTKAQR